MLFVKQVTRWEKKSRRKSKHNTRNQNGFKDILLKFQQQDYSGAASLFKKTRITSAEAGKAKQLKAAILHQIGLQYFSDKKYTKTIELLSSSLQVQSKTGFPLPFECTHTLLGLSYLHIGQFEKAAASLKKGMLPTSNTAAFYHLLALIYNQKETTNSFDDFLNTHQTTIATLEQNQQTYLQLAWNLVHKNFNGAELLLQKLTPEDNVLEQNTTVLHHLLQGKKLASKTDRSNIKTLYKVLANLETSDDEKLYLEQFEEFEEYLFNEQAQEQSHTIEQQLSLMCNEGIPLEDEVFQVCFNHIRDDLKSYLVYNQIANLYNVFEGKLKSTILRYLRKYSQLFFQIPESAFLYLEIVEQNPDKIRPESFWKSLSILMDRFSHSWRPGQLDAYSWKIQALCLEGEFARHNNGSGISTFCIQYPNLIGLKFQIFMENCFGSYKRLPNEVKDIFSLESSRDNKKEIILEFSYFIQSFSAEMFSFMSFLPEKEEADILLKKHHYIQDCLLDYITLYPKIADKSILQEIYTITTTSINEFIDEYSDTIDRTSVDQLENKVQKGLQLLGLEEQIQSLKSIEDIVLENDQREELKDVLYSYNITPKTKTVFLKHIQQDDAKLLITALLNEIDVSHYDDKLIPKLTLFFKLAIDETPKKAAAIIDSFTEQYHTLTESIYCDHPHRFYCNWLNDLFKFTKNKKYHPFVYSLLEEYHPKLIDILDATNYNTASKALTFIMKAIKTSPDFEYNLDLVTSLLASVKIAAKKRRLKGLSSTAVKVEQFFNDLD